MRVASLCSGVGGSDIGWMLGGHQLAYCAESDPFRRAVLETRFGPVPVLASVRDATWVRERPVDLAFIDLPAAGIAEDYGILTALVGYIERQRPAWVVVAHSPARPCGRLVRSLALRGYDLQLVHMRIRIETPSLAAAQQDVYKRALLIAGTEAALLRVGLRATEVDLIAQAGPLPALGIGAAEVARLLPAGWTCVCGVVPCRCDREARVLAVREATPPPLTVWLGDVLTYGFAMAHPDGQYRRMLGEQTCAYRESAAS